MEAEWAVKDRARWDRLVRDAPWQQHWAYGEAVEAMGGRVLRCAVRERGRIVALAQFTARSLGMFAHGALCARGPVIVDPSVPAAAVYRCLRRSTPLAWPRLVLLSPEAGAEGALARAGLRQVMTGAAVATLDLRPSAETLRAGMAQKWRNRLNAAERDGTVRCCVSASPAAAAVAVTLAREQHDEREKGYRGLPTALVTAWGQLGGKRALMLATAKVNRETVAQMLFVRHGTGATYHAGWSDETGRRAGAHPMLIWQAMLALKADGVERLDLGTIDTRRSPGLARFKLGSGAQPMVLAGSWT